MVIKGSYYCALELAIDLVGGKWKLSILWHLRRGTRRFGEIKNKIGNITQKVLTLNLRELEQAGLIDRIVYPVIPPKVEYSLTERGRDILPTLISLYYWAYSYGEENGIPVRPKTDLGVDKEIMQKFLTRAIH